MWLRKISPESRNRRPGLILDCIRIQNLLFGDGGLDGIYDIADIVVADPGTGREADAYLEERFRHAVDIGRIAGIYRLSVHWLPERSRLDAGFVESHAQCLDIGVRLAVGDGACGSVCDSGGASYGSLYHFMIGILLTFHMQVGVESGRAEPVV